MYHIDKKVGIAGEECVGATCVRVAEMDPLVQKLIDQSLIDPKEIGPNTVLTSSLSVPDEPIEAPSEKKSGRTSKQVQVVPNMDSHAQYALVQSLSAVLRGDDDEMWERLLDLSEEDVVAAHHALGKLMVQVLSHGASFQIKRNLEEELRIK